MGGRHMRRPATGRVPGWLERGECGWEGGLARVRGGGLWGASKAATCLRRGGGEGGGGAPGSSIADRLLGTGFEDSFRQGNWASLGVFG